MTAPRLVLVAQACGLKDQVFREVHPRLGISCLGGLGLSGPHDPGVPPPEAVPWWDSLDLPVGDAAGVHPLPDMTDPWDALSVTVGELGYGRGGEVLAGLDAQALSAVEPRLNNLNQLVPLLLQDWHVHGDLPPSVRIVHLCETSRWGHVVEGLLVLRQARLLVGHLARALPRSPTVLEVGVDLLDVGITAGDRVVSVLDEQAYQSQDDLTILYAQQRHLAQLLAVLPAEREADQEVWTNLVAGTSLGKNLLANATVMTAARPAWRVVRTVDGRREGLATTGDVFDATLAFSSLQGAIGRTVDQLERARAGGPGSAEVERGLAEQGLLALVGVRDGARELGDAAGALAAAADYQRPLLRSACAEVLWRRGERRLAERLEQRIRHWQRAGLWRVNLVPEMVLHDEVHGATVDRHLSVVAGALLERGAISPRLFAVLALTAWLHDWGHVPVAQGNRMATSAPHVRDVHGLNTRTLLWEDGPWSRVHDLTRAEAAWVGLLSAHHQGWTSCGGDPFTPPDSRTPALERAGVTAFSFHEDVRRARRLVEDAEVAPADEELVALLDVAAHRQTLDLALALVRVCDAADVGVHRVPGWRTAAAVRQVHWQAPLSDLAELVDVLGVGGGVSEVLREMFFLPAGAREDDQQLQNVRERLARWEEADLPAREPVGRLARERLRYVEHVLAQRRFFDDHSTVAGVYLSATPLSGPLAGKVLVVPHVRPNRDQPRWAEGEGGGRALRVVRTDVHKELGRGPDGRAAAGSERLEPLRWALDQAGLVLGEARLVR